MTNKLLKVFVGYMGLGLLIAGGGVLTDVWLGPFAVVPTVVTYGVALSAVSLIGLITTLILETR